MIKIITFGICILIGITVVPIAKTFIDRLSEDVTSQPAQSLMLLIPLALLLFVFIYAIVGQVRK